MADAKRIGIFRDLLGAVLLFGFSAEFFRFSSWWESALAFLPSAVFLALRIPADGRRLIGSWWAALGIGFLLGMALIFVRFSFVNG